MAEVLPLSALLSRVLVAYTVEFDNEFEHRVEHWTTMSVQAGNARKGVWLVSMVMCLNVMRLVPEDGITVAALQKEARTEKLNLPGMARWRYITIAGDEIRPTTKGSVAKKVWQQVFPLIEARWQDRFGEGPMKEVRASLLDILRQLEVGLPAFLPILGYGLFAEILPTPAAPVSDSLPLPVLLAKVLLAFTLEFERDAEVSLAVAANLLRLLTEEGILVRNLPRMSGVSKESLQMAVGFLEKHGYTVIESDQRTKVIGLSPKGVEVQKKCLQGLANLERQWENKFGSGLATALQKFDDGLLRRGMEPYPDGWRASLPRPVVLPQYPMVLHRGGYPDGS